MATQIGEITTHVERTQCLVCVEDIDGIERLHAFGHCNHLGVCSLCYLRLRRLLKEMACVLCKSEMEQVMVCEEGHIRPFEEFHVWGDSAGPGYEWDDQARMFLPKRYSQGFVRSLQENRCTVEGCRRPKWDSMAALERHLREQHQLTMCKVCLKYRKVFLLEQTRYTPAQLQRHIVEGSPELGFKGHPRCEFCKTRFYDSTQLHQHLVKDHYSCHLCEKLGILHKYYRDYSDLERHFGDAHFLCDEEECLSKKFVVFMDEIDLQGHILQCHPNKQIARKIQVNFTIRRSNRDGTGNELTDPNHGGGRDEETKGEEEVHEWTYSGPSAEGEGSQSPEELQARREAARAAARAGGMIGACPQIPVVDEFPSLSGGGAAPQGLGWGRGGALRSRPRTEDFPQLPLSSRAGTGQHGRRGAARGGGVGGGGSFLSAVEPPLSRAQVLATSGAGEGGWCYDYPMPPPEGSNNPGARGMTIGNMKLKVDKKVGKKKKK
ncbi:unnamed protein product, partial [Discosporangium mesarthrocarpum]